MDALDAIVVGAGPAGSAAALAMAKAKLSVLLVDRGKPAGSKNLSGAVLWGHSLEKLVPGWFKEAPVERPITRKGHWFLTPDSAVTLDIENASWGKPPYNGFSLHKARFDKWLAGKAQEAGATLAEGVTIEKLAIKDGKVNGVIQDGQAIRAKAVILADGCNSRLTPQLGIHDNLGPMDYSLGVKETIKLSPDVINERFHMGKHEGLASHCAFGFVPGGVMSGGFFYTNKDTITLGAIINLKSLWNAKVEARDIVERFRLHPSIRGYLKGGQLVEYGAKLIPEWGYRGMQRLHGDGFLLAGESAGFLFSNGLIVQGINYAIDSGRMAGEAVVRARKAGDFSAKGLASYRKALEKSYVLKDMKRFRNVKKMMWTPEIFKNYPQFMANVLSNIHTEEGKPKKNVRQLLLKEIKDKNVNIISLIRDGLKGAKEI